MKSQELAPLYDQQQVYHRRRRNQRCALKQWTEKSVWSFVCAMELGLVSESVPNRNTVNVSSTKWPSTVHKVNNSFMVAAVSATPTTSTNRASPFLSLGESSSNTQNQQMQIPNRQIVKTPARKRQVPSTLSPETQISNTQDPQTQVTEMQQVSFSQENSKKDEFQLDYFDTTTIANDLEPEKEGQEDMKSEVTPDTIQTYGPRADHEYAAKEALMSMSTSSQSELVTESESVSGMDHSELSQNSAETPMKKPIGSPRQNSSETPMKEPIGSPPQNSSETPMNKPAGRPRRSETTIKSDSDYEYEPPQRKKKMPKKKKKVMQPKPKVRTEKIVDTTDVSTTDISYESSESSTRARRNKKLKAKKNKEGGSSEEENEELHKRRIEIRRSLEKARENESDKRKSYNSESKNLLKYEAIRVKLIGKQHEYESSESKVTTRRSLKNKEYANIGSLVWGNCSGWWPALVVHADHVGMLPEAGKLWVYWIAEARISLLNEKTQVEPFSSHLKARLSQNSNAARLRAIDATMQMLRARLDCTLTKPYYTWLETNLIGMFEMLDEIRFYPYPSQMQDRINHLKRRNARAVEKYLEDKKRTEENQGKKSKETEKKDSSQTQSQVQKEEEDLARLPLAEQKPGVIAWAKILGHSWWPAMIVDYRDCCMREPTFGCQWIIWYGDYQLSEVHHQFFLRFDKGLERMREYTYAAKTRKPNFVVGVLQAAKDFGSRVGLNTEEWTLEDAFTHIPTAEQNQTLPDTKPTTSYVKIYDKYTPHIVQKLNESKKEPKINFARANEIIHSDDLQSVISGNVPFDSLCLKCMKIVDGEKESHPFFEGSLCIDCAGDFKPFMFVFGNDGKCFYCTVCSATGTVLICDKDDCPRVYCAACVKHLLCPDTYREVLREDPWYCFLCKCEAKTPLDPASILKPRIDWREKIIDVFRTNSKACRLEPDGNERRKIRVLSLFDGLATGLLVLEKLGLVVDVYYASEIDADSMMVSTAHFGNRIQHLGDVRKITKEKLEEIAPIDLLIGGSPCNDLSLANPGRRGLNDWRLTST
ncbi:uncharacterized protein LOC108627172 isoform X2 [Ceratina calcarata]|uniref:DNA (cytosine-5-)-methyltransferase n=1 Tax=Ceratina calcarata TaxID=156304 RepID=A0AAJ7S4Q4_9HYME|nr:uncharacterized protein LOC108627172 isoform X2 [Ceratina calcarata]